MSERTWSLQDAKNHFSAVVDAARREPQMVTKHGRPAVVVVDVDEYQRLRHLDQARAPSFADLLLTMPQDDEAFPSVSIRPRDPGF